MCRLHSLAAAFVLLTVASPAAAQCQIDRAYLQGPQRVMAGEPYTISWTNVLTGPRDSYTVERSTSPEFTDIERFQTTRPVQSFKAPASGSLYHRVLFAASCLGVGQPPPSSNILTIEVADCALTAVPGTLNVTPQHPPAFTTYIVWWGPGDAEPVGGKPLFRLRRTTTYEVKESVSESVSAAFSDAPGEYSYQVRLESACGAAGPWSVPVKVTVGGALGSLVLVSDAAPVDMAVAASAETSFQVRNAGTQTVNVSAAVGPSVTVKSPSTPFALAPNQTQKVTVVFGPIPAVFPAQTLHTDVELRSSVGESLKVPVGLFGGLIAEAPVTWDAAQVVIPRDGSPVVATFSNSGAKTALVYGSVPEPWLSVESTDGQPWDRPMAAGESRTVRVRVDRSKRRAPDGTETGRVTLTTSGFLGEPKALTVLDDGPPLVPLVGPVEPPPAQGGTRILYASLPNAVDARGVGRYTGDLWVSNLDSVSSTDVQLLLTPIGQKGQTWRFVLRLAPGETRRYRNLMGSLVGYEGACALELRSSSPAVSATALVSNVPFETTPAGRVEGGTGSGTSSGQYGFELRPVSPGEGVKDSDQLFVLSGLAHDARRRTNILLTETSGYDTKVRVELFESTRGDPVLVGGQPVKIEVWVPALGTVQLNDPDLFGAVVDPLNKAPYAKVTWLESTVGSDGVYRGSVVPFGTVIDAGTQDASLRVGVSPRKLDPSPSVEATAPLVARAPLAGLPYSGGPAPLLLPVAHVIGGPLASGEKPFWKTRVSFTNTHDREIRTIKLKILDQTKTVPDTVIPQLTLSPGAVIAIDDVLEDQFGVTGDTPVYGAIQIDAIKKSDGSGTWQNTWADVDVQTETYTVDPSAPGRGEFKTGMEGFSYLHGYSSFQSNLGTVQIEGAESSSSFRTNLILEEVGNAYCGVAVSAYRSGSFVPLATKLVTLAPLDYVSKDLFRDILGLDLSDLTDIRVVVKQIDGDGVFMAFASKIDLKTGDPANLFLRPASAGTGR